MLLVPNPSGREMAERFLYGPVRISRRERGGIFAFLLPSSPSPLIERLEEVGIVGLAATCSEFGKVLAQQLECKGIAGP